MSDEKRSTSGPDSRSANADKGGRRRYFWRKKHTQKPGGETSEPKETKEPKEQPKNQRRATPKPGGNEKNEKPDRDIRTRRRRRRPRSRQGLTNEPKVLAPVVPVEDDYVPPKSIFVYTHIVRPEQRDSYEFRAEHFSKVSRRLEDFDIDLSKLFPDENQTGEGGEHAPPAPPRMRSTGEEFADNED